VIDATRSPRPLWRRLMTFVVVALLIVVFAWAIWVRELHHPGIKVHALAHLPALTGLIPTS
jgi:uncharacterized membrane protein